MRYIKAYETFGINQIFWKIPTKRPEYYVALERIGMTEYVQDYWHDMIDDRLDYGDQILIFYDLEENDWAWERIEELETEKLKYDYQGEINITPEDIEIWELKKNVKNYNI